MASHVSLEVIIMNIIIVSVVMRRVMINIIGWLDINNNMFSIIANFNFWVRQSLYYLMYV